MGFHILFILLPLCLFRLSGCFCSLSIFSWEIWCNSGYCIDVLSNSIWWPVSMLCSDNADCVMCFSLTSRWCSFIRILTILPVSPMYTFPQEQGILYLCGTEWRSLIFRIFQNLPYLFGGFENGLNVVLI